MPPIGLGCGYGGGRHSERVLCLVVRARTQKQLQAQRLHSGLRAQGVVDDAVSGPLQLHHRGSGATVAQVYRGRVAFIDAARRVEQPTPNRKVGVLPVVIDHGAVIHRQRTAHADGDPAVERCPDVYGQDEFVVLVSD